MKKADLKTFFIDRIRELYDKKSLDSYRVSTHNTISLVEELYRTLERWLEKKIKNIDTIKACFSESVQALKQDNCLIFDFLPKQSFTETLLQFEKNLQNSKNPYVETKKILLLLNKFLKENKKTYLSRNFDELECILFSEEELEESQFMPEVKKLDSILKNLSCEILQVGFSKESLYYQVNKRLKINSFDTDFRNLRSMVENAPNNDYIVILRLKIPDKLESILSDEIFERESLYYETCDKPETKNILKPSKSIRFYTFRTKCKDIYSAVKSAQNKLSSQLDLLHIGMFDIKASVEKRSVVLLNSSDNQPHIYEPVTQYVLDGNYSDIKEVSNSFVSYINNINNKPCISIDVKDRINSALRYLRLGNEQTENEQKFINYWIALEFIFSSAYTDESTFMRIKVCLTEVLACCYAKRNLLFFNNILVKHGIIDKSNYFWEIQGSEKSIYNQNRLLIRYRYQQIKSRLLNKNEDRHNYIKKHAERVEWHLIRLYRLRNELIHEAAMKANIENVTSNLRYYLVFLLNQIIIYFKNVEEYDDKKYNMIDFFNEYSLLYKKLITTKTLDCVLEIPLNLDLIK